MKVTIFIKATYTNGQTDGMHLYKCEGKGGNSYVWAANSKDAKMKAKAGLFVDYSIVGEYLKRISLATA